nr:predicted GPI-anchored protein 58 [Aegilops tauschii subsp. strangulata]
MALGVGASSGSTPNLIAVPRRLVRDRAVAGLPRPHRCRPRPRLAPRPPSPATARDSAAADRRPRVPPQMLPLPAASRFAPSIPPSLSVVPGATALAHTPAPRPRAPLPGRAKARARRCPRLCPLPPKPSRGHGLALDGRSRSMPAPSAIAPPAARAFARRRPALSSLAVAGSCPRPAGLAPPQAGCGLQGRPPRFSARRPGHDTGVPPVNPPR